MENGSNMIDLALTLLDGLLGSPMMVWCTEISSSDTFWPFPKCLKMVILGKSDQVESMEGFGGGKRICGLRLWPCTLVILTLERLKRKRQKRSDQNNCLDLWIERRPTSVSREK